MMMQNAGYDPELIDWTEIDEAMREDIAERLVEFHQLFRDCFKCSPQRLLGLGYLRGLVSDVERKNIEAIALAFGGEKKVRSMQNFLSRYPWDEEKMLERSQRLLHQAIGDREGMWCVDSTEFPKKGKESVGVARQYCGARGKTENCQSGVFASFTSEVGYGLLEGRLYLPQLWFSPEYQQRRQACHIPPEVMFATKTEIALELLGRQKERGIFHAWWVGCDSFFGVDSGFRDELAAMGMNYLAAIKPKSKVWVGERSLTVAELASEPIIRWQKVILAEGAKGPIATEVARVRVRDNRDGKPGLTQWLILRRLEDGRLKYYLSNASALIAERTLAITRVATTSPIARIARPPFGGSPGSSAANPIAHNRRRSSLRALSLGTIAKTRVIILRSAASYQHCPARAQVSTLPSPRTMSPVRPWLDLYRDAAWSPRTACLLPNGRIIAGALARKARNSARSYGYCCHLLMPRRRS